jgi:serine protease Do
MKKIILMIIIILVLFCSFTLEARPQDDKLLYEGSTKKILELVSPSVVKVVAENHRRYYATGIAIDSNFVISNRKVLANNYRNLYIETHDGKKLRAKLKGQDGLSSLIILEVGGNELKPIKRAESSKPGDWVAIVGAFYGSFPAIYDGHVSSASDESLLLDAPAVPGSSGAAVVNRKGELVAALRGSYAFSFGPNYTFVGPESEVIVQSSKSTHRELCYAVPTSRVLEITDDLKKYGKVKRGWLGVNLRGNTELVAISDVTPDSPAAIAGLKKGDILVELKGDKVKSIQDVQKIVRKLKPDQKVTINVLRGDKNRSLVAVVGDVDNRHVRFSYKSPRVRSREDFPELMKSLPTPENYVFRVIGSRNLGIHTLTLNPELAEAFKVREGKGLMISKVMEKTAAERAGLMPKDIITKIDGRVIAKTSDLREALNELREDEPVKIKIYRNGVQKIVTVTPDNNAKFESIFDHVNNSLNEIHIQIEEENKRLKTRDNNKFTTEQKFWVDKNNQIRNLNKVRNDSQDIELKKYKSQVEKLKQEQEQMKEMMLKLMKKLEEKEKDEKKDEKDSKSNSKEKSKQ